MVDLLVQSTDAELEARHSALHATETSYSLAPWVSPRARDGEKGSGKRILSFVAPQGGMFSESLHIFFDRQARVTVDPY